MTNAERARRIYDHLTRNLGFTPEAAIADMSRNLGVSERAIMFAVAELDRPEVREALAEALA